jgi:hypothetical protein
MVSFSLIKAQEPSNIIINSDGSVTGTISIQQVGSIYTLTANISGTIQVQRSSIVIDGAGYSLSQGGIDLTNGVGQDPTHPTINNVTIENLYIESGSISTNGGGNDTFYNDYIPSIQFLGDCVNNNITFCSVAAISFDYGGNATITENNLTGNILVWLSFGGIADRNYWSDYLTKYPNATEIDNSGVGTQPYVYATVQNYTQTIYCQDNHPLMKPVAIPIMGSSPASIPEFPLIIAIALVLTSTTAGIFFYKKKRIPYSHYDE